MITSLVSNKSPKTLELPGKFWLGQGKYEEYFSAEQKRGTQKLREAYQKDKSQLEGAPGQTSKHKKEYSNSDGL